MSLQAERWPSLPLQEWEATYSTLHRWTQIVGKIRLRQTPWINHSWHVTLYPTARGLTTSAIPHGTKTFQIDFDFLDHRLLIESSDGGKAAIELRTRTVADFYAEVMKTLEELALPVRIYAKPNEIPDATPFYEDEAHAAYDPEYVMRWWRIVSQSTSVLQQFRARFLGKCSPVHFFWGSFDLAVTRFSGRRAPPHPGGIPNLPDWITREAYSHEVSSCGFWPGGGSTPFPLFYAYAYPEPNGFASAVVRPSTAVYHTGLREYVLPYDEMRHARSPEAVLLDFAERTYEAAATLSGWDRISLERQSLPKP
jgi:hypothetical protein